MIHAVGEWSSGNIPLLIVDPAAASSIKPHMQGNAFPSAGRSNDTVAADLYFNYMFIIGPFAKLLNGQFQTLSYHRIPVTQELQ